MGLKQGYLHWVNTADNLYYITIKVKDTASDGEFLAKVIVEKLQRSSCSVSFADIAKQAANNKKPALAALVSLYTLYM